MFLDVLCRALESFFSMNRIMVSCFRLLAVPRAANSQSLSLSGMQGLEVAEHLGSSGG